MRVAAKRCFAAQRSDIYVCARHDAPCLSAPPHALCRAAADAAARRRCFTAPPVRFSRRARYAPRVLDALSLMPRFAVYVLRYAADAIRHFIALFYAATRHCCRHFTLPLQRDDAALMRLILIHVISAG